MSNSYTGLYLGKIEQRVDPKRQGRLRVRIVTIHSSEIKVEQLPWAFPKKKAWKGGGGFHIPPLYGYVYIQFLQGNHEYPVWDHAWWAEQNEINASGFGGNAYPKDTLLQSDPLPDVKPEDQPNNFFDSSPNGKNWQLDDRFGRERVVLADQLDNMLFINTEHGVATLEASTGLKTHTPYKQGITLDSFSQAAQLYTHKGWKFTVHSTRGVAELAAPIGHKIRIETTVPALSQIEPDLNSPSVTPKPPRSNIIFDKTNVGDEGKDGTVATPPPPGELVPVERISFWTAAGNRFILDEYNKIIVIKTQSGKTIVLDDQPNGGGFLVKTKRGQFAIDDASGDGEWYCDGNVSVKAKGDMGFSCEGKMTLDGAGGVFFNQDAPVIPAKGPNFNTIPSSASVRIEHHLPDNLPEQKRAQDYPYYETT